jgi:hypothetical protein
MPAIVRLKPALPEERTKTTYVSFSESSTDRHLPMAKSQASLAEISLFKEVTV